MCKTRICACGCGLEFDVSKAKNCSKTFANRECYKKSYQIKNSRINQSVRDERWLDNKYKRGL